MKNIITPNNVAVLPEWLNVEQAASYLKVSKSTVYKMVFYRKLPYYKPGNKLVYFKKSEIDETIERSRIANISQSSY